MPLGLAKVAATNPKTMAVAIPTEVASKPPPSAPNKPRDFTLNSSLG